MIKEIIHFIKSDIKIKYDTCWYDNIEKIDGIRFHTKNPFSNTYQWHSAIGIENTYEILSLISNAIKRKERAVIIEISHGVGYEKVYIWKGSFKKSEKLIYDMIKEIQIQY